MTNPQLRGTPFNVSASGTTNAQAVTSVNAVTYYITDISGSSSIGSAGTWALFLGPASSATILWQGAGIVNTVFSDPIKATATGTVQFLVNGTTLTYANFSGFSYP